MRGVQVYGIYGEIAELCGFPDVFYFTRLFKKSYGRTARKMAVTRTFFFPGTKTCPVHETAFAIFFDERRYYPISFYPFCFYPIIFLRYISAYP